ncbi:MAG TPA: DNA translocase FtsK 4TM domain-containing protein [Candidatus Nanoarchaeia archaeon]
MRRRALYRSPIKLRLKKKTVQTVGGLILIGFAGLSLLALFGADTGFAKTLRDYEFEYVGWAAVFLPIASALLGAFLLRVGLPFTNANSAVGFTLFLTAIVSFTATFLPGQSGLVGNQIANFLSSFLTTTGAAFILFITATIALVVTLNTSLSTAFDAIGKSASFSFNTAKTLAGKNKEKEEEKKELPFATRGMKVNEAKKEEEPAISTAVVSNLPGDSQIWEYPPLDLLTDSIGSKAERGDLKQNASIIEKTLESFGIQARVVEVNMGPAITQYAIEIALGTKLTKITSLANDIALALAAPTGTVRIEAPIPGKSLVGIEVPNITPEIVPLKTVLASGNMQKAKSKLTLSLGLDVSGGPVVADLSRMPHVLIAGSTGSGKSVAINAFICNLLFRANPSEVKMILVDPKIVELSGWNGIPHLLTPVITEPEKVLSALKWAITEMGRRYKAFAEIGARNIDQYNEMSGFQALPYIVIIIDELADLMLFAPVEVEDAVTRLAQMSRATGIHMILATQRPSVDVLTGLIKANIPSRIAFNVASQIDSRVIIDQPGAEKLLGRGDMLYVPPDASKAARIQGVFVSEPEINKLKEFLKKSGVEPQYTEEVTTMPVNKFIGRSRGGNGQDEFFEDAVRIVCQTDRASASLLQRKLSIGYARAARILDELEEAGVVGSPDGAKPRDVLVKDPERVLGGEQGQTEG